MMAVISVFSGSAGVQLGEWSFVGIDKLAHFLIFGLLGICWIRYLGLLGLSAARCLIWAVGLSTAFGLFDELHQFLNPFRYFEWADLLADFAGALVAAVMYQRIPLFRDLLEFRPLKFLRLPIARRLPKSSAS